MGLTLTATVGAPSPLFSLSIKQYVKSSCTQNYKGCVYLPISHKTEITNIVLLAIFFREKEGSTNKRKESLRVSVVAVVKEGICCC